MNVGFYYMANAFGRLIGTITSGALYSYAGNDAVTTGLAACFAASFVFVVVTAFVACRGRRRGGVAMGDQQTPRGVSARGRGRKWRRNSRRRRKRPRRRQRRVNQRVSCASVLYAQNITFVKSLHRTSHLARAEASFVPGRRVARATRYRVEMSFFGLARYGSDDERPAWSDTNSEDDSDAIGDDDEGVGPSSTGVAAPAAAPRAEDGAPERGRRLRGGERPAGVPASGGDASARLRAPQPHRRRGRGRGRGSGWGRRGRRLEETPRRGFRDGVIGTQKVS